MTCEFDKQSTTRIPQLILSLSQNEVIFRKDLSYT